MNTIYINWHEVCHRANEKRLTERDLLKAAGLNQNLITHHRRHIDGVQPLTIKKLADALGCEPADIMTDTPNKPPAARTPYYIINTEKIRLMAINNGLSERGLLQAIGASPSMLSHARKGKKCTISTVKRLADALGCEPADIIKPDEEEPGKAV